MQWARTPSTPTPINGANAFLISGWLGERVRPIQSSSCGIDGGAACVHAERRFGGIWVGHKHVKRLMRQRQLSGLVRRRRVRTTIRVPRVRVAKELVGRDFTAPTPNRLWVADISYGRTWAGTKARASSR